MLGDLTESAFLSGQIYDLLLHLFVNLKYKDVYIVVGNHDKKPNRQGSMVLSYKFLQSKNVTKLFSSIGIHVIDKAEALSIEGIDSLVLPYTSDFSTYEQRKDDHSYDAIFGHFTDTSDMSIRDRTVDISHLKASLICLGHQHNPGNHYIGSVVPNSTSEAGKERSIWILSKTSSGIQCLKESIPCICDYYTHTFPDPLGAVDAKYPIWTMLNCASEDIAKEQYDSDMYVLKCIYQATMDITGLQDIGVLGEKEMFTNAKLFTMWKETVKFDDDSVLPLAQHYLDMA
jgi:hypothetical protein